jgi:hypothetical protein
VDAGSCCSEAGLELKRMLVLEQLLVCCQATFQKSDDASHDVREFEQRNMETRKIMMTLKLNCGIIDE